MKHFLFIFIALSFSLFGNAELASVSVDSLCCADLLFVVNNKGNAITANLTLSKKIDNSD